ncbi:MAG: gamma-glutamylcyclotransferase [Deltaproteobacteria bacterium]|nr:MAG: gamma-glutamylcyclotransferase [Deltaproteobacteria bacterium]
MTKDASNDVVSGCRAKAANLPLFVYGTLIFPEVVRALLGALPEATPAVANGFSARTLSGRIYPGLLKEEGESAKGVLYQGLDSQMMEVLDRFEGEEYTLSIISVQCGEEEVDALVYLLSAPFAHLINKERWDLMAFKRDHLSRYVELCKEAGSMSAAELTCDDH